MYRSHKIGYITESIREVGVVGGLGEWPNTRDSYRPMYITWWYEWNTPENDIIMPLT